jgi:hypothetical protein
VFVDHAAVMVAVDTRGAQVDQPCLRCSRSESLPQQLASVISAGVIAIAIRRGHVDDGMVCNPRNAANNVPLVEIRLHQQAPIQARSTLQPWFSIAQLASTDQHKARTVCM